MVEVVLLVSFSAAVVTFCTLVLMLNLYLRKSNLKYAYKYIFKTMCDVLITRPEPPVRKLFTRIFVLFLRVHKALCLPID